MIEIEILGPIDSDGFYLRAGDRALVNNELAQRWCDLGWADVSGRDGACRSQTVVLDPHDGALNQSVNVKMVTHE